MKTFLHRSFTDRTNDSHERRWGDLSLFGMAVLACFALSSCMFQPGLGSVFDKTQPVPFIGSTFNPNEQVTIQARDPQTQIWGTLGTATSSSGVLGAFEYLWVTNLPIPSNYWGNSQDWPPKFDYHTGPWPTSPHPWTCATVGDSALVRAATGQGASQTFLAAIGNDYPTPDCRNAHPDNSDFVAHCATPNSPNVVYGALGYRDFGQECADLINTIRNIEGVAPLLKVDEEGECTADIQARCNYEEGAHSCGAQGGGSGQNECATYSSVDDILKYCIWQDMYQAEKACYQQGNCTKCPVSANGSCGHYLHMINPNFVKVVCGIYKGPDGQFKAVQDFFDY